LCCDQIHTSVAVISERFFQELRRHYYTTPKSYLDLIGLYVTLLRDKREDCGIAKDRLLNGLNKLTETNILVDSMKSNLAALQPVLESKARATAELLIKVPPGVDAAACVGCDRLNTRPQVLIVPKIWM
jgi:dynein heavy chain, axonemal